MKALSIRQPWAELLISGRMKVINLPRPLQHRGRLIIHASMQQDWKAGEKLLRHRVELEREPVRGAVLGVVDVLCCDTVSIYILPELHDKLAEGPYVAVVRNPHRLRKPIRYMGHKGLFEITEPYILEQLPQ